jgi:phenylalanyl-tRNA synthetase beta chain
LFELGPRFTGDGPGEQVVALAGLRYGEAAPRHWAARARPVDALDAKGDALAALAVLGVKPESLQTVAEAPGWYHPGRSGSLRQGRAVLATFGELHPRVRAMLDLDAATAVFELDLDAVPMPKARAGKARPMLEPLPYPPVDRDFAFIVADTVRAGELIDAVRGADRRLIREIRLFDVYAGKGIPEAHKSLAIAVRLQAADRTLTEADIDAVAERIVAAATKATGAVLRQ